MYTDFEQDLILACKNWYGENGIEKVISDYVGYIKPEEVTLDSKYHFIFELYLKLCEAGNLKLRCLLSELSPRRIYDIKHSKHIINNHNYRLYEFPRLLCDKMISEICNVTVIKNDNVLIELHNANPKFIEKDGNSMGAE